MTTLALKLFEIVFLPLLGWVATRAGLLLLKKIRELEPIDTFEDSPADRGAEGRHEPCSGASFPDGLSLLERIGHLEAAVERAGRAAVEARRRGASDEEPERARDRLEACLRSMSFLAAGDVLGSSYRLIEKVGGGRTAVVWKAYDEKEDRVVALKILRHSYLHDGSVLRQFRFGARALVGLHDSSLAAVVRDVQVEPAGANPKLAFYALEYVAGEPLRAFLRAHPERRIELLNDLLRVGRCIERMHAKGLLLRDLKPDNLLVTSEGALELVDFDALSRVGSLGTGHFEQGNIRYSAPEVFDPGVPLDERVDVFSFGRLFAVVYLGRELPSAYEMSVTELIDVLNCTPMMKAALRKATRVARRDRYRSLSDLLGDLEQALEQETVRFPFFKTIRRERRKLYVLLRHSFVGTLTVMLLARPSLGLLQMVQLSDKLWVAVFHAVIGSLVWGVFIPAAFLVYLVLFARARPGKLGGYLAAMALSGLGGFLGGLICALPSVFVTNATTLQCLGWLTGPLETTAARFSNAFFQTRMFLAFPLTGTLTGMGLGLALNRGIVRLLRANPHGSGLLPVPAKRSARGLRDLVESARLALGSWRSHLCLALPLAGAVLVAQILDAAAPSAGLMCNGIAPRELLRCVGEGAVHYLGAMGLATGFFFGVRQTRQGGAQ